MSVESAAEGGAANVVIGMTAITAATGKTVLNVVAVTMEMTVLSVEAVTMEMAVLSVVAVTMEMAVLSVEAAMIEVTVLNGVAVITVGSAIPAGIGMSAAAVMNGAAAAGTIDWSAARAGGEIPGNGTGKMSKMTVPRRGASGEIGDIAQRRGRRTAGMEWQEQAQKQKTVKVDLKGSERIDDLQRNGYQIIQDSDRFCFGMDAVLLTGFARAAEKDNLLDLGTGTGIIPILMEAKYHCSHLAGLEIQEESADMARRSVALNGLSDKIEIVTGDIKEADNFFPSAFFDCITCNPPYMIGQHGLANPTDAKAIARHEILCTFEDVVRVTAKLLRPGGHFFLVHRPFRLAEIMTVMSQYKLEPKRMRLVYPYVDREPNMVLLDAVRGGKPRMTVEKPLVIFEKQGVYTPEIREKYGY